MFAPSARESSPDRSGRARLRATLVLARSKARRPSATSSAWRKRERGRRDSGRKGATARPWERESAKTGEGTAARTSGRASRVCLGDRRGGESPRKAQHSTRLASRESQSTISGLCLWRWWADHRQNRALRSSVALGRQSGPVGRAAVLLALVCSPVRSSARSLTRSPVHPLALTLRSRRLSVSRTLRNGSDGRRHAHVVPRS